MNEDWKNWNEPDQASMVLWTTVAGERRAASRVHSGWYSAGCMYSLSWPDLLDHIATYSDGTQPRIIDPWAVPKPEPERVVVWESGDPIDKLKPYVGQGGVAVRAERNGAVMTGPLTASKGWVRDQGLDLFLVLYVGGMLLYASDWKITVTAPKPVAPWWQVDHIEEGYAVSWTTREGYAVSWTTRERRQRLITWNDNLDDWRGRWDKEADPTTWRVTDVHAAGGPKLIAGTA